MEDGGDTRISIRRPAAERGAADGVTELRQVYVPLDPAAVETHGDRSPARGRGRVSHGLGAYWYNRAKWRTRSRSSATSPLIGMVDPRGPVFVSQIALGELDRVRAQEPSSGASCPTPDTATVQAFATGSPSEDCPGL